MSTLHIPPRWLPAMGLVAALLPTLFRPAAAAENHRLDHAVVPTFESVRLTLDPAHEDYRGSVHIDLAVTAPTDSFRLYAKDMDLIQIRLAGGSGEIAVQEAHGPEGLLVLRTSRPLAPGAYGLDIHFQNNFDTRANGLYRLRAGGDWYAYTQFEADAAREAFPCWDEPEFKIPFQLTVLAPAGDDVVSNTPVESTTTTGGEKTVVFRRTPPLPSYLVAIAVGPFEYVEIRGMSIPGRVVTTRGSGALAAEAARLTPPIVAALEKYFGRPYPYAKLDLLAVPEFAAGAMENAGAVTFRDEVLLVDPAAASARQRYRLTSTAAHELAHMWFGDLVTLAWWDDIWLNEAFASWMGDKVTHEVAPQFETPVREILSTQRAMKTDAQRSARAIRQPVDAFDNFDRLFDALAYNKGQAVLGMLETWLGPDTFRRGVLAYLKEHEWKNATAADLWRALSAASGKDIAAATSSFLDQPGVPLVSLEPLPGGKVLLRQSRFRNAGVALAESVSWNIPVTLQYSDGRQTYTQSVLLSTARQTVTLEKTQSPAWIHPNYEERGYYHWSLPPAWLDRLAAAAPQSLDPRERVGFLGNLSALLDGGEVHGDDYVRTLGRLADDRDPTVLTATLGELDKVDNTFVTPGIQGSFEAWVRKLLHPAFERYGTTKGPGEQEPVSLLRPELLTQLAVYGGDPRVQAWADSTARACLDRPGSVDASVAGTALNIAARRGGDSLFAAYRLRFEGSKVPAERSRYLTALGNFRNGQMIDKVLAYVLTGPLRPQELLVIPRSLGENEMLKDHVWRWFLQNYDAIAPRVPPYSVASLTTMARCCTESRIADAEGFFLELKKPIRSGTQEELAKVTDSIRDCVELRRREAGPAAKALLELAQAP
jgi:alanyl aminopeptidase